MLGILKMLSIFLVAEALTGLIYHRPVGENFNFQFNELIQFTLPDDGRSISQHVTKDNMIQDMINSDNMNSTESTIPNILIHSLI